MATISASMVKELREKTGAGMLDCKKALEESNGDMEAAIDYLRKKGLSAAAKKSSRITAEGAVCALIKDGSLAVLVEVNCETDFVARNPEFQEYVSNLAKHVAENNPAVLKAEDGANALMDQKWIADPTKTVNEITNNLIAKIGENISPRRFIRWELQGSGRIHSYIHMGSKLGVLVEAGAPETLVNNEEFQQFVKMTSMHIAAANPMTVERSAVPADVLEREREIYKVQVRESGKPENMVDKIVEGKLNKFYKDNCLLEQIWVHDNESSVAKAMADVSKRLGGDIGIRRFARWMVGEGLEKRSNDLVADVAQQLKGK